jgi:endonuclease YncB( thermonuclease family)
VTPNYVYNATVVRVIDGDTVLLDVDCGFYVIIRQSCRLSGLNAIEHNKPGGPEATAHLLGMLPAGQPVVVRSAGVDKYAGRFEGVITLPDGRDVGAQMVADGYAAIWNGTGPRPTPPWPIPVHP